MNPGEGFAEALSITDYSASPYVLQSSITSDGSAMGYVPIYWSFTPQRTGYYCIDLTNSIDIVTGELVEEDALNLQLFSNGHDLLETKLQHMDWFYTKFEQGVRYYLVASRVAPPPAGVMYALRVGEAAVQSEWITPVPFTKWSGGVMNRTGFQGTYTVMQALGAEAVGDSLNAFSCCWRWARRGDYGSAQWWSPSGAAGYDDETPWSGQAGVCSVMTTDPDSGNNNGGAVGYALGSSDGLYATVQASAYAIAYYADDPKQYAIAHEACIPELPPYREMEWENTTWDGPATVVAAAVRLVLEPGSNGPSKVRAEYAPPLEPGQANGWGLSGPGEFSGGAAGGPETLSGWQDYVEGATFPVPVADYPVSDYTNYGFALYVAPAAMFSDSLPPGVTTGASTSTSADTERGAQYGVTYQAARYRITVFPVVPDLEPAFGPGLQGTGVLLGVTTRFTAP